MKYYRPKERTDGLEKGITNVVEQEVKLHYQEVYDRGYQDGINDAEQNHAKSEVIMANGTYYNTRMIDKSNFSQEQYKVDLQSAYDCGYEQAIYNAIGTMNEWMKNQFDPDIDINFDWEIRLRSLIADRKMVKDGNDD